MENNNRAVYIAIAIAFIVLLGTIIYLELTEISAEDMNATVDARVAMILTDEDYESTNQAQVNALSMTEEARETRSAIGFPSTSEAQRSLALTDVAVAYPSNTPTSTPTVTSTPTSTPSPTEIDPLRNAPIQEFWDTSDMVVMILEGNFNEFEWSPDEQFFLTEFYDDDGTFHEIRLYNRNDFDDFRVMGEVDGFVRRIAWSPDGELVAVSDGSPSVTIWDSQNWELLLELDVEDVFEDLLWMADSNYLIGSSDMAVIIWDAQNGEVVDDYELDAGLIPVMSWNPDLSSFVVTDRQTYIIFAVDSKGDLDDVVDNRLLDDQISAVDWSPDGSVIAMADGILGDIFIVDSERYTIYGIFEGHKSYTVNVEWSPNSLFLASSARDNTVRIWHRGEFRLIYDLNHGSRLLRIRWASDGTLVTNSLSGIYFWDFDIDMVTIPEEE